MKGKTKGFIIGGLSATLLLGGLGAVAYLTNGFKDTTKIRELSKSGTVVEKLELTDDNNYLVVKNKSSELEDCRLLSVDEVIATQVNDFDQFANALDGWNISTKDMNKMWDKIAVRDRAYSLSETFTFHVSKEEQDDSHYVEIPYFDTIRINYTVDTPILAIEHSYNFDAEKDLLTNWNYTQDGKGLYQEVGIFEGKNTADTIGLIAFSLDAVADFEVEIESIELVNKSKAKASDVLYIYDYANHI